MHEYPERSPAEELLERRVKENLQAWATEHWDKLMREATEDRRQEARRLEDRLRELADEHRELDRLVRGERGDNGLTSTMMLLERAEKRRQDKERARARKEWAVLLTVIGLALAELWQRLEAVASP